MIDQSYDLVGRQRWKVNINLKTFLMYISDTFSSLIKHIFINIPARIRIRIALSGLKGHLLPVRRWPVWLIVRWALTCHLLMALSSQWYHLVVLHLVQFFHWLFLPLWGIHGPFNTIWPETFQFQLFKFGPSKPWTPRSDWSVDPKPLSRQVLN